MRIASGDTGTIFVEGVSLHGSGKGYRSLSESRQPATRELLPSYNSSLSIVDWRNIGGKRHLCKIVVKNSFIYPSLDKKGTFRLRSTFSVAVSYDGSLSQHPLIDHRICKLLGLLSLFIFSLFCSYFFLFLFRSLSFSPLFSSSFFLNASLNEKVDFQEAHIVNKSDCSLSFLTGYIL